MSRLLLILGKLKGVNTKMKYNVWAIIEMADDENNHYDNVDDEQVLLASFDSLEDARAYIKNMREDK